MADSSPADIAVTFRSIARRLNEALAPVHGDAAGAGINAGDLEGVIDAAARVVGTDASANDIADSIAARPVDSWSAAELTQLRGLALDAGRLLRTIAAAAEAHAKAAGSDDNDD